jgi:hypothetical protein
MQPLVARGNRRRRFRNQVPLVHSVEV